MFKVLAFDGEHFNVLADQGNECLFQTREEAEEAKERYKSENYLRSEGWAWAYVFEA